MRNINNYMITSLGFIIVFILGHFFLDEEFLLLMVFSMAIICMLSMLMSAKNSFAILISFILIIAFYNVIYSWFVHVDITKQALNINNQLILSLGAFIAWIFGYTCRKDRLELIALQSEVAKLRKVEENTGILTFNEFLEQAQILFTGMKRRNEEGFFIKVSIDNEIEDYQARIINEKISKALLNTIRAKYDIACQLGPKSILLYLNNTTLQGVQIVLDRLEKNITKDNISIGLLKFEIEPAKGSWNDTAAYIHSLRIER